MHLGTMAQEWTDFTDQERFEHIEALRNHFVQYVEHWSNQDFIDKSEIIIDAAVYSDVIRHYYGDLLRMSRNIKTQHEQVAAAPNEFKQKAIYAFWLRKLKPITITKPLNGIDGDAGLWINEIIAIHISLTELDIIFGKEIGSETLSPELYHDLLVLLRSCE